MTKKLPPVEEQRRRALRKMLTRGDAEFLLKEVSRGKYRIRVGQIWNMPELRGSSTLLLDYDNCRGVDVGKIRRRLRSCEVQPLRIRCKRSPSGSGYHCTVRVKGRFSPMAKIALQAILESDPSREAQNFRRVILRDGKWGNNYNVLFKKGEI